MAVVICSVAPLLGNVSGDMPSGATVGKCDATERDSACSPGGESVEFWELFKARNINDVPNHS